jgi:hypothetical protein
MDAVKQQVALAIEHADAAVRADTDLDYATAVDNYEASARVIDTMVRTLPPESQVQAAPMELISRSYRNRAGTLLGVRSAGTGDGGGGSGGGGGGAGGGGGRRGEEVFGRQGQGRPTPEASLGSSSTRSSRPSMTAHGAGGGGRPRAASLSATPFQEVDNIGEFRGDLPPADVARRPFWQLRLLRDIIVNGGHFMPGFYVPPEVKCGGVYGACKV